MKAGTGAALSTSATGARGGRPPPNGRPQRRPTESPPRSQIGRAAGRARVEISRALSRSVGAGGGRVGGVEAPPSYAPSDRAAACYYIEARLNEGEYVTGLIYIGDGAASELHSAKRTAAMPLNRIPYES